MKYKCIPAPDEIVIDKGWDITARIKNKEKAVRSFAELINNETTHGWEFHSMENIAITEKPGCIGALFGRKSETTYFNMLVFSNENDNAISQKKKQNNDRKDSFEDNIEDEREQKNIDSQFGQTEYRGEKDISNDNNWICGKCGTTNGIYLPICKKCGKEFSG
jgi:rubrerythrin